MSISADLRAGLETASSEQTRAVAAALAQELPLDVTLALHGNLGVGKTTFVQGLAQGLGVLDPVTSPTFSIYSVYRGTTRTLVHLDAYRLDHPRQIEALLLEDFLDSPWCLAIEWPEKIEAWIPGNAWHLTLGIVGNDRHRLSLA